MLRGRRSPRCSSSPARSSSGTTPTPAGSWSSSGVSTRRRGLRRPAGDPGRGARDAAPWALRAPRPSSSALGARPGGRPAPAGHPEFGVAWSAYLDDRTPVRGSGSRGEGGPGRLRGGHAGPRRLPGGSSCSLALPLEAHLSSAEGAERHRGRGGRRQDGPGRAPVRHAALGGGGARGPPVISLAQSPITGWARVLKRGTDLGLAGGSGAGRAVAAPRGDRP